MPRDDKPTRTIYLPEGSGVDGKMECELCADDIEHSLAAAATVALVKKMATKYQTADTPDKFRPVLASLWAEIALRERQ